MRQQDLVWVRLPFSNLEQHKARPAVVVSNDTYNERHDDVVVCAVTSNLQPSPYKVPLRAAHLVEGHLPLESMVRADKVLQVEKALIGHSIGRLDNPTYDRIAKTIGRIVRRTGSR